MRIDFILGSPAWRSGSPTPKSSRTNAVPKEGKAPSDHAPVMVDLRRE